MNNISLKEWGAIPSHIPILKTLGIIIIMITIANYGIDLYSEIILKNIKGGSWTYISFVDNHRIQMICSYFIKLVIVCVFYIGAWILNCKDLRYSCKSTNNNLIHLFSNI